MEVEVWARLDCTVLVTCAGKLLDNIFEGIPRSFLIMFPTVRVGAVDVDVEELCWEIMVTEGIPWSRELVVKDA